MSIIIEYRPANKKDNDSIYQLLKDVVTEGNLLHRFSQTEDSLYQALFSDEQFVDTIIAENNRELVGFCLFSFIQNNFHLFESNGLFIHTLCVNKDYRRLGIATRLMQEIRKIAEERGCDRIDGIVLKSNEKALHLCESLGDVKPVDYIHYVRARL